MLPSLPSYVRDPSLALRMTVFFLSFWGKYATAAGGGKRERVCGGEAEL